MLNQRNEFLETLMAHHIHRNPIGEAENLSTYEHFQPYDRTMNIFQVSNVDFIGLSKSTHPISTGIGFLDHMIDQLNSHAQIGVSISVFAADDSRTEIYDENDPNRHSGMDQSLLMSLCGTEIGEKARDVLQSSKCFNHPNGMSSRFCCPLDEALVECHMTVRHEEPRGKLVDWTLPPYGIYPKSTGRIKIGHMETKYVEQFFQAFAESSGLQISLRKLRGDNGHHIVESAFKAFSRALRNLLDGTNTNEYNSESFLKLWGPNSDSQKQSLAMQRCGLHQRQTKETSILVDLQLDGGRAGITVETGVPMLNEILKVMASEGEMSLKIECHGDLFVDDHHTSEDVAIAIGQIWNKALGTKAGLNRMWCAEATHGIACVEVTMDLSNRPCITHDLTLTEDEYVDGILTTEMFHHVLESLTMNALMTVHIAEKTRGLTVKDTALATATAFGRALHMCAAVDPRRAGTTASSKGTLSI
jgi:imidazoleglycerol-phosphate dehydratase